jgi:hypothetical protein
MRPLALAVLCAPLAAGCASYRSWSFGPSPQEHEIALGSPEVVIARVQVAVAGLDDVPDSDPPRVEMRFGLRVANESAETIELATESLELVDGDLRSFGAPSVAPEGGGMDLTVEPQTTRRFDLAFGLPDGAEPDELDLSGLSLRFGVVHEGRVRQASARFERGHPRSRYEPGWNVGVGFGFVNYH